jgi:hypothetical protein
MPDDQAEDWAIMFFILISPLQIDAAGGEIRQ